MFVRHFDAEYLDATRRGMWESREALAALDLASRERILDVGCGTGVLTRVLREEATCPVVGLDADADLLAHVEPPTVQGDATRLPVRDGAFDLVVCQALLVNLPDPIAAVEAFARASSALVAVVEPDNADVTVESTVDAESRLASRARELYLDGVATDADLGARADECLQAAGVEVVSTTRYDHVRTTAPPYDEAAIEAARRRATGAGIDADREQILAGDATVAEFDALREAWRAMGRDAVAQMGSEDYERTETVPFYVTVGRV